jgi:hypothetical protein
VVTQYQLVPRRPSYVEQLMSSKRDLMKLLLMSLVVVIGLSIHHVAKFLVKEMLATRTLSFGQELALRAAYPLIIVFFVWNFKIALQTSK